MGAYGYRKCGNAFWRTEGGFYQLIHIQGGAYGDYAFINVALHPLCLPQLRSWTLELPQRPKEYECLLRLRLEHISAVGAGPMKGLVQMAELAVRVLPDIAAWHGRWSSWEALRNASPEELRQMFSVVPALWEKEYWLLQCCCACSLGDSPAAAAVLTWFREVGPNLDNPLLDRYLKKLLENTGRERDG